MPIYTDIADLYNLQTITNVLTVLTTFLHQVESLGHA